MKKIILSMLLLVVAGTANAQWHHHHRGPQVVYRDSNWIAPLIIGGIVGSVIANQQQPVIVQQQPVYVQPQPVIVQRQTVCTEWKEIQTPDGQIYRERTCTQ